MIELSAACAREMGMEPYYLYRQKNMAGNFENVGYSLPGKACIYNILIICLLYTSFTEIPGWQHIGDEIWKKQAVENVKDMVEQYRNHPSVILWGVRINESGDDDAFRCV